MQRILVYYAYKIKDGLYIGNQRSPNELEFLTVNKITYIVNCASSQIQIQYPQFNVLNFDLEDSDQEIITSTYILESLHAFIEEAVSLGEGVLICSFRGQSRALSLLTAYMMKKYSWGLYKTFQFLNSRRKDFEIRASFLKQLIEYEKTIHKPSKDWNSIEHGDALILKNTYLNSQISEIGSHKFDDHKIVFTRIIWADDLETVIDPDFLRCEKTPNEKPILKQRTKFFVRQQQKNLDEEDLRNTYAQRFTSPKIKELHFDKQNTKFKRVPSPSLAKVHRKQLLDIYLDCAIISNTVSQKTKLKRFTPIKDRHRSISEQQSKSPKPVMLRSQTPVKNIRQLSKINKNYVLNKVALPNFKIK